jgi:hypothetical protein
LAAQLYIRKQTDGLSEDKKIKAINLLDGITEIDEINRKLKIIIDTKEEEKVNEEEKVTETLNENKTEDSNGKGHNTVKTEKVEESNSSPWNEWLDNAMRF